ncbi:MAG: histidine kinase [Phaeodactylibacter sp.]|uniref:sensor histidine kinase n=1 Tax=Phaeodactylibacter sp. TaxID=1940289 RepID=UPI0032EB0439
MKAYRISSPFPIRKLLFLMLALAVGVQLIVVSYNHFTGFYPLSGWAHFGIRLGRGILLSLIAGSLMAFPDLWLIQWLNRWVPWSARVPERLLLQLLLTVVVALLVGFAATFTANALHPYQNPLSKVLLYNALIFSVVNIVLMAILEGMSSFWENRAAQERAQALEQELSQIRFEVLKHQINPHFMFNSLNVLSGLIEQDKAKAQDFIDEFSMIYRYVLETIEQPVVALKEELRFAYSYLSLQQMRYGEGVRVEMAVPAEYLEQLMPPLSMQVVLENAIKHNIANASQPLHIEVSVEDGQLVVRNNLQPKVSNTYSAGLGQRNLAKRYQMVSAERPAFIMGSDRYEARLPLIKMETG